MRIVLLLSAMFCFVCCNSGSNSNNKADDSNNVAKPAINQDEASKVSDSSGVEFPAEVKPNQHYAYVKKIVDSSNMTFLEVEKIQLLTGDKALEAAKKKGDAAYDKSTKKYYLPDDYYIINKKERQRFALSNSVKVNLVSNFYRTENKVKYNNLEGFKTIYLKESNWPVLLSLNNDGKVIKLQQIYLP